MNTKIRSTATIGDNESYNPRLLEHMTYRNNISEPILYTEPPELQYELERKYLWVSSTTRDRTLYPNSANFKVNFPAYRDVLSIELSGGILPSQGNIVDDGYILLDIPELNHIDTPDGQKYFGILGLQHHPNRTFYNLDKSNTANQTLVFKPLKKNITSLTIILRHPDGSIVSMGDEAPNSAANHAIQTSFTFEIRCRVPRRIGIDKNDRYIPIV